MSRSAAGSRGQPVLVTGGAGFIGSHLVAALLERGARVRVLDDLSSGRRENLDARAELRVASILDEPALAAGVAGCGVVFHLAAQVSVPQSVRDPRASIDVNVTGTQRVLEAARRAGVRRLVFASSSAVYGEPQRLPSREDDALDCRSPYAAGKAAAEAMVAAYGRCYDLSTVSLRFFNVFGPRQDPLSPYAAVIAAFLRALRAGEAPVIYGDGHQSRDFVAVGNIVHALLLAATCPQRLSGPAINVGTGVRTDLLALLDALGRALGVTPAPRFQPPRPGDVLHSVADIARADSILGYRPIASLEQGIRDLVADAAAVRR
jgi:nucleoside-diphosphate-sugar epimerase